jgi:hypothetical protein
LGGKRVTVTRNGKDNAMTRMLLLAAAALSLILPAAPADAASKQKKKYYHHYGAGYAPGYYGPHYGGWRAPVYLRTPGPPWAMPNECYTDEGYGRYTPCSRGRGG